MFTFWNSWYTGCSCANLWATRITARCIKLERSKVSVGSNVTAQKHRNMVQHSNEENMGKVTKTQKHIFFTIEWNKKHRDLSNYRRDFSKQLEHFMYANICDFRKQSTVNHKHVCVWWTSQTASGAVSAAVIVKIWLRPHAHRVTCPQLTPLSRNVRIIFLLNSYFDVYIMFVFLQVLAKKNNQ